MRNSAALGEALVKRGFTLTTGGTDNHLVLWDLRPLGLTGSKIEKLLERASVSTTRNQRENSCSPYSFSPTSLSLSVHAFYISPFSLHFFSPFCRYFLVDHCLPPPQISANKNAVPGDKSALAPGGVRLGTCAMTTRGLREDDFDQVGLAFLTLDDRILFQSCSS